ncbi:MAG: protein tyrosine phosphatase family protein [Kofleriaceae bacterium]
MSVAAIKNFIVVADRIGTAGQPTEQQLREIADDGYRMVINLGLLDKDYSLPDEAGVVAALGLGYRHIPVAFDNPTFDELAAFLDAMDAATTDRVFVHCALNYRVSSFIALYGELRLGWTREQADAHARRFWSLNPTWLNFLTMSRAQLRLADPTKRRSE